MRLEVAKEREESRRQEATRRMVVRALHGRARCMVVRGTAELVHACMGNLDKNNVESRE